MDTYVVPIAQGKRAIECLARFFFKNNVSLMLIEAEDLCAFAAVLGLQLPTRKRLVGELLDAEYERVRASVAERIKGVKILGLATGELPVPCKFTCGSYAIYMFSFYIYMAWLSWQR